MRSKSSGLMALAALAAAASMPAVGGAVNVMRVTRDSYPEPRIGGYRQGRRFNFGNPSTRRDGSNPAGTKLARKAARGTLTIVRIR